MDTKESNNYGKVQQPEYNQINLPGQTIQSQQMAYPPGQQTAYQSGQQMAYPPGQHISYPPGQEMMYGNTQGQQMIYPPGQQMTYGNPHGQRIITAPNQEFWMERPQIAGCPPGLEYLTQINQLLVKQKIELLEVLTGFETNNKYDVRNALGQIIYKAKEDTDCCTRYFCGPSRPFVIHISDNMNQEVITIRREYKCHVFGNCCSFAQCCQDEIEVQAPPGEVVGYVKQMYEGCNIRYTIMDEKRDVVMRIHGPSYFHCYCPGDDYPLSLMSADGEIEVGKISKQWSNLIQEYFTDADNFGIQFPMDLDVRMKAVVLGAVFLIDFMFFESQQKNNSNY